jgi:hypothetical protein
MSRLAYLFLVFILASCVENEKTAPDYFVINPFVKDSLDEVEPIFYGDHNFILADSEKIYYHDNSGYYSGMCGTGIDFTKPPQLYLTPDSLKEIKKEDLLNFLKTTKKHQHYTLVSISFPVDTIRNKSVFVIQDFIKNKKKTYLGIRKFTEEEDMLCKQN